MSDFIKFEKSADNTAEKNSEYQQYQSVSKEENSISANDLDGFAVRNSCLLQESVSPELSIINEKFSEGGSSLMSARYEIEKELDLLLQNACLYGKQCQNKSTCKEAHYERLCSTQ